MIYDCFPFFNELDILEIRLNELNDVVDRFVLVESTKTFQNKTKPLYFNQNKERFKDFKEKINHVIIDQFPKFSWSKFRFYKPWDYSNYQKNQIKRGLTDCKPEDIIIVSDLDEIPKPEKIDQFKNIEGIKVFQQLHINYYLNCICIEGPEEDHLTKNKDLVYWHGSVMVSFKDFSDFKKIRLLRNENFKGIVQIPEGGWHFSFIGEAEKLIYKLTNWEHSGEKQYNQEYLKDPEQIKEIIDKGDDLFGRNYKYKYVDIDKIFPVYLLKNKNKFRHLIK